MSIKKNAQTTYFLSYECGFVAQTSFELTPLQYLDFLITLIPHLRTPLKTKIQVETISLENKKFSCCLFSINTNDFILNETTWGGGAFNNCLNEIAISDVLQKLGYPIPQQKINFPLIANSELFNTIQSTYQKSYPQLTFQHIDGLPRQAVIFSCSSIQNILTQTTPFTAEIREKISILNTLGLDLTNPHVIKETLPKSINIHNQIPTITHHAPYCPLDAYGFYPINNHLPNEDFDCLDHLEKTAEIEFRIGSTQINTLCSDELPKFKQRFPHLNPADSTIDRKIFPTLWLLQKAKRVCLNLSEVQQIIEHESNYTFLPRPLEKDSLITRFVEDFGIQEAIVSDSTKPLTIASIDRVTSLVKIEHFSTQPHIMETLQSLFQKHQLLTVENETGCGDALVIGLELGRQLRDIYFPQKTNDAIAQFGLNIATAKFLWKESNFGNIPKEILQDIVSNSLNYFLN